LLRRRVQVEKQKGAERSKDQCSIVVGEAHSEYHRDQELGNEPSPIRCGHSIGTKICDDITLVFVEWCRHRPNNQCSYAAGGRNTPAASAHLRILDPAADGIVNERAKTPVFEAKIPVYAAKTPVYGAKIPVFDVKIPVYGAKIPVFEAKIPVYAAKIPVYGAKILVFGP
jgi:hypothetical protein